MFCFVCEESGVDAPGFQHPVRAHPVDLDIWSWKAFLYSSHFAGLPSKLSFSIIFTLASATSVPMAKYAAARKAPSSFNSNVSSNGSSHYHAQLSISRLEKTSASR